MIKFISLFLLAVFYSQSAFSQSLVIGDGGAKQCYLSVRHGDPGRASTIRDCKKALADIDLSRKDKAATHVNLGILQMRSGNYTQARKNYDGAIALTQNLPEAYINNSAALIYMGEYKAAIESVNKGIELGTKKMPEALFNRAMAFDHLKQYSNAYRDLKKALEFRPNWAPAVRALGNYEIIPAKSN